MGIVIEIIGWSGSLTILLGYILLSSGHISSRSLAYQLMNILGGVGMVINGWYHGAMPSVANNVIWSLIGLVALIRHSRRPAEEALPLD